MYVPTHLSCNLAVLDMLLSSPIVPQISLALLKHFEEEILEKTSTSNLLILLQHTFAQQPPEVLTKVLQDAFHIPNLEPEIIHFETEETVKKELHENFYPRWESLPNHKQRFEALLKANEELIEHIGFFHGAIVKLQRAIAELKYDLDRQSKRSDRLAALFIHIVTLSDTMTLIYVHVNPHLKFVKCRISS